jgi:ABC-type uncharacterized transport system permease subunit
LLLTKKPWSVNLRILSKINLEVLQTSIYYNL